MRWSKRLKHGYIVEGDNPKPVHNQWGVYDFPAIKAALSDPAYHLIAEHRPKGTDAEVYATALAAQVQSLLNQGVRPRNITLLGFSRGGAISILASDKLRHPDIKTIILAGCGGWLNDRPEVPGLAACRT